jgi:hypothetical protein
MRLLEFQQSQIMMSDLIKALQQYFDMERVGGDSRVYNVGERRGIIFLLNNSLKGLGLIWSKNANRIESVGVWHQIDFDRAPDVVADIPVGELTEVIAPLVAFIRHPKIGVSESLTEGRDVTPDEFRDLVLKKYGMKARSLTINDLNDVKAENGVEIPPSVQHNTQLKVDASHWNLFDEPKMNATPDPKELHPEELAHFAKVNSTKNLQARGAIVIMGRKANGELFEIPGIDQVVAQLERMIGKQLDSLDGGQGGSSMEDQYRNLESKVQMITEGKSTFIKSLLITGMPSAGKTFRVMKVVKASGLEAGRDYVTKKGKISAKSLYRVLIQQLHGLAIFDDCDSVVKDANGVNMLKGALDTETIRTVDYDVEGLMNTDAMDFDRRGKIVGAMSAILRGVPTMEEMKVIEDMMPKDKKKSKGDDDDDYLPPSGAFAHLTPDDEDDSGEITHERIREAEAWVMNNLPNKIDYYGRIIFISNMSEKEWTNVGDGAIINRAFHQNMEFSDSEMLDYIDTIKQHIVTPNLTDDNKTEVLAYLRELWQMGKISKPINFRLVQQCFDLYLMNGWKSLMAAIG